MTMATRFELISTLYDNVSKDVIRSPSNWQEFLKSSCNNYRLPFSEQLLVYAQKPDAVAVLPMASWNRKFGRWVNKGAKGIALFDVSNQNYPRLKYVFDVSDTHEGEQAKEVPIWHMKDEYTDNVIKTLENVFGAVDDKSDLSSAVISACENAVSNNLSDYLFELCGAKHDSFLEDFSDDIISSKFRKLVSNSVSYTLLSRLGVNADLMLDTEDFEDVVNFNTPNTFNALGEATNNISKTALLEISKTIFALEKENRIFEKTLISSYNKDENKNERSNSNEDNIHTSRRAALSESDYADKDGTNGILRTEKTRISQKSQESDIHNFIDNLQTDGTPDVDSGTGTADGRTNHNSDGKSTGSDRETQTNEYDDLGGNDEQYQELGEGNSIERTDLHDVTDELPPFVDEQAIRYMLSNPDDDLVQRKSAIIKAYQTTKNDNELINYTKTLYPRRFDEYDKFNKHFGFTLADNGLLMYEGNYKTRTKESVFSWDIVVGIIKELINDGKYLDTEKEEKTQLDLFSFSYDNEPVYDEIPQTSLFTDFGISQQIIDEALCCGFNDKNSRVQIAMHFRRDRGVEYNARMLKLLYGTNGAGFVFNGEKVSFWYDENGISIAKGTSAKTSTATHLTWEQAAVRIRELLDVGRYMPQYELDKVDDYELNKVADRLTEFIRDLSDDYPNKDNCLQSIQKEIDGVLVYPDMVEKITDMLKDDEKRVQIFKEYGKLMDDYNAGMKIISFNYAAQYSIPYIAEIIEGMKREPIRFKAESGYLPDREMFISQDEIDKIIINGKNNHAYRLETYTYFVNHPDKADRIKYVGKDNQSGYLGGNDNVNKTTKGIEFSHGSVMEPYAKVLVKWSDVAKRIDTLIKQDKFVTQEDIDAIPDIYKKEISRDLESFFEVLSENDAKPYPNDIEPYKISRVIKAQLDNSQALDDIENMMSNALALMDKEDRMYQYRKQIYDDFVAYKNGTFKLYDYPNLAPKVKQPSKFTKPAEKEKVDAETKPVVSEVDDGLDLIDEEIDIDGRHFVVDSVSNGYVSMADQTFADGTGFPIFRRETVEFVRQYLPTEKEQIIPTQNTKQHTEHSQWDIHPEISVEQRHDFDFAEHPVKVVGKKERFRRNMEAIKVLKECEADNRFATPDEQIVLSKYVGWGGIPEAFDENNSSWANEYKELISVLSPEEYNAARESTLTAFYTPQEVVKACYDIAENLGFKQGNILEPSCGIGNFIGMKPKSMADSKVYGIELDSVSAAIAQQLYQNASIVNNGYEKVDLPDNFYDLVTTNVPFGDFKVSDKKYDKHNPLIHDYFFMKSLDKVRTGGIMILITSKGTMDKENSNIRRYIAQRADLLGAIRLPNDTFKGNAGTEVVSDILVLQKRDRVLDIEPNWVQLDNTEDGIRMNKYFVDNPDMVLGNMKMVSGRFGPESTCIPYEDRSLEELLDMAVKNVQGQITEVQIGDEFEEDGKRKAVLNKKETSVAQAKQKLIEQAFEEWIWKSPERREELCKIYNERFNSIRPREYDGSHINFYGMNPEIKLRPHQINAIAHIMYGGNTLLAHTVGAGKTFEMVAAAQESKRLGLCNKSLFVVPNHLTEQWASEYLQLYPAANILVATKKDFETKNRKKFCGRIATGDYDAVIIGHSQFEKIPMSIERQRDILQRQIDELIEGIAQLKSENGERFSIKQLEKSKKSIEAKLKKLNDQSRKDDVVTFEELGVDRIFIDERHYYKNLYLYTKMTNVGGIAQTEAQKSSDLFMKTQYLDEITGGRGVIFATGTPISNSMVELYTIQRYLQYDTLRSMNLQHFDSWASTFGQTVTAVELTPEGTGYRAKTRFSKFYNLPELMSMFKEVADIQTADMLKLPVPEAEFYNVSVKPSEHQKEMIKSLSERADKVRNGEVDSTVDNMLKITNDGRKLALDQRLLNPMLPDFENSKVNACVDNVYNIWKESTPNKSAQLLFCDLSTPKGNNEFSVYTDIRKKLIAKGIPEDEIKFIHEADTEVKKQELFKKVRKGDVRVLLGSTSKMGAGTNCQTKLIALHDLDCPWRPSDVGRILRTFKIKKNVEVTDNGKIII